MAINVTTADVSVKQPLTVTLSDRSGAHVELTLVAGTMPPLHHAFAFTEGTVTLPLPDLKAGTQRCTLVIQAFKHKSAPNRMYDVECSVNGKRVASAQGNIPSGRTNDVGFGDFTLNVTGVA